MNDLKKRKAGGLFLFLPLLLLLGSCINSMRPGGGVIADKFEDYEVIRQDSKKRAEVIKRTSTIYSGRKCSAEERRHQCFKDCDTIYSSRRDRKDCEELSIGQVKKLKEAYTALDEADENDLNRIERDVFELFLSFSIKAMDDIVHDFKNRRLNNRAETILIWLVENEEMAKIFESADRDYKTLNKLLNVIRDFSPDEVYLPFSHIVRDSDTIIDIVVQQRKPDSFVMDWFMEFIEESPSCERDAVSINCFEIYCKIGDRMNTGEQGRILDIQVFEKYMNNIIEDQINRDNWSTPSGMDLNDLEDSNDLESDWVSILCGGLT